MRPILTERRKDRLATVLIRTGGLLVILVVVGIVINIGSEAVPLFQSASGASVFSLLTLTALLGSLFVAGQMYEFTTFYREGLGFTTSLFSSSFYTLTGFHGVHVSVGVIILLATVGMNIKNRIHGDKAEVVEIVGLYWHFVDIVWILIFTLVYLIPA